MMKYSPRVARESRNVTQSCWQIIPKAMGLNSGAWGRKGSHGWLVRPFMGTQGTWEMREKYKQRRLSKRLQKGFFHTPSPPRSFPGWNSPQSELSEPILYSSIALHNNYLCTCLSHSFLSVESSMLSNTQWAPKSVKWMKEWPVTQ